MQIANKTLFITGANRGIGKALVEAALQREAAKIYAAARELKNLPDFKDNRVVPIALDITNKAQIEQAAQSARDTQLLINNAGVATAGSVLEAPAEALAYDMTVNYFGTLNITRSFVPTIAANGGGIATISSIIGLAPMAGMGGYSASKAALASAIQSLRAELKPKHIEVFGIYPGPIDTDMARDFPMEKSSTADAAQAIFTAIEQGEEDIFPDKMSAPLGKLWKSDPKALERQFASM